MLEVRGLSRRFGGLQAVRAVDLDVAAGSITALIGPNGAGKTTCFAMIAGFIRPDAGRVRLAGQDVTGLRPDLIAARGMVRTFQITQPFAGLSVLENIRVGAYLRTADSAAATARAREVGTRLGLGPLLDRPAAALTVAGRKRLEVARARHRPAPAAAGRGDGRAQSGRDRRDRRHDPRHRRGVATILLIEHIMQAVAALAGHVYVLAEGALIAQGTPRQIADDPAVIEAYLGHGAAARLAHA